MKRYSVIGVLIQCLVISQIWALSRQDPTIRHVELSGDDSCMKEYNYKLPPDCTPSDDCQFVLTWKKLDSGEPEKINKSEEKVREKMSEQWMEYHMEAVLSESLRSTEDVWVALGFSSNPQMGDTDVIACWYSNGSYSVHDGFNSPDGHQFSLDEDSSGLILVDSETSLEEGKIFHCTFQRPVDTRDRAHDRLLSDKQYILLSMGALHTNGGTNTDEDWGKASGMHMLKHTLNSASACACGVMSCSEVCSCPDEGFLYQLRKLHGVVMSLCFLLLFPMASVISRYYKVVYVNSWFKMHMMAVASGVLLTLVGMGFILTHTQGEISMGIHQLLGIFLLTLVFIQLTLGGLRPIKKYTFGRKVFCILHRIVAISLLTTSIVEVFLGVWLLHNVVLSYMMAILSLHVLLNTLFILVIEVLNFYNKFSNELPVGYHKVTKHDELSESEDEVYIKDELKDLLKQTYNFEKGFLLLFFIQNFIIASLIGFLIFYFHASHML